METFTHAEESFASPAVEYIDDLKRSDFSDVEAKGNAL
jgi:hypothetical protein